MGPRGLQGGLAIIKLARCTGILLGLRQLGDAIRISQVEDNVVISLTEVLDNYTLGTGEWEKEFGSDKLMACPASRSPVADLILFFEETLSDIGVSVLTLG